MSLEAAQPVLDARPSATQKPYAPAEGAISPVSPPPFIWLPAGKGMTYTLQVSTATNFPAAVTKNYDNLTRTVFVPSEVLPAGQYHWRYGVKTSAGMTWSKVRSFQIAANARPFAFPNFNGVIAGIPKNHPRLFFPGDRLERIRAAAKAELKPVVDDLVKSCRKAIGEKLVDEPDYQPKTASERGPWAVRIMQTTRPPMDVMERCALAYLITGNREIGQEAKRRLLYFFSWNPEGPTSFFAYDEPPMWVMMRGTRAYDFTYDLFTSEERNRVEANMRARAAQFFKRLESLPFESSPFESHAGRLPGFLGESALCFAHEWPEARKWLEYVTLLYYTSYPAWGGDDGGWHEGPMYWTAYMGFAVHFVVALRHATDVDLMQKPFFRNTPFFGLYTATPYHEHSPFGDGQYGRPGASSVMYTFSTLLQDPHLRWYADAARFRPGADVLSLATYDPTLRAEVPTHLPQTRVFPAAGLASIHTALGDQENDISFLLRSSPLGSTSHGHADQNAFVIEAFGRGLAIATGQYPWYGSPHHEGWTRATRAVNSILVDGQGQDSRSYNARGQITSFCSTNGYDYVEADAANAYAGRLKTYRRQVVHVRPGVFVICDTLEALKPATFQWLLHAYEQMQIEPASQKIKVIHAPATMEVQLLRPAGLTFSQTDKYKPEPENIKGKWNDTWHLKASTTKAESSIQFLAILTPHKADQTPGLKMELLESSGALGVKLSGSGGVVDTILFRATGNGERVSAVGKKANGEVVRKLY